MGKFDGIYLGVEDMLNFVASWSRLDNQAFFMILTPHDLKELKSVLEKFKVPENRYYLDRVPHDAIPGYLSAADFGLVAVPSLPSQKFRSPIKVGEYLCCGLPYLVGPNISDDDRIAEEYGVGVVIQSYDSTGIEMVIPKIETLLSEEHSDKVERCRKAGIRYRGLSTLSTTSDKIFDRLFV
jgi:hypothetical protein